MGAALGVLQINAGDNVIVFIEPCKAFAKEASVALRKVYANVFMDASGKRLSEREKRDGIARIALSRCSNPGEDIPGRATVGAVFATQVPLSAVLPVVKIFVAPLNAG
jgi:hypothetical protein